MLGIIVTWIAFRSLKPIAWVIVSVAIGCLSRFIGLLGDFDRIHLLTLVFGASLIGGAQDYGTYFYATDSPRMRVNLTHGNYCVGSRRR